MTQILSELFLLLQIFGFQIEESFFGDPVDEVYGG